MKECLILYAMYKFPLKIKENQQLKHNQKFKTGKEKKNHFWRGKYATSEISHVAQVPR